MLFLGTSRGLLLKLLATRQTNRPYILTRDDKMGGPPHAGCMICLKVSESVGLGSQNLATAYKIVEPYTIQGRRFADGTDTDTAYTATVGYTS